MNNVEDNILRGVQRSIDKEKHKGETYLRISEEIINDSDTPNRIQEKDFDDIYGQDETEKDIENNKYLKEQYSKNSDKEDKFSKRYSDVLETIISELGEDWFGSDVKVTRASKYDDHRGTDLIFEFGDPDHVLAVDITYSSKESTLYSKIEELKYDLDKGSLSKLKYFQSQFDKNKRGALDDVPKVIAAVSFSDLKNMAKHWSASEGDIFSNEKNKELARKRLKKSPVQIEIMQQISAQLESFIEKSREKGREDLIVAYDKILNKVKKILQSDQFEEINKTVKNKARKKGKIRNVNIGRANEVERHLKNIF